MCSSFFNFIINNICYLNDNYILFSDSRNNINNFLTQHLLSKILYNILSRKNKLYKVINYINSCNFDDDYKSFINMIFNDFIIHTRINLFSLNYINHNISFNKNITY